MSILTCPRCGEIYDTDYEMEEVKGEMVCDRCWEIDEDEKDKQDEQQRGSHGDTKVSK